MSLPKRQLTDEAGSKLSAAGATAPHANLATAAGREVVCQRTVVQMFWTRTTVRPPHVPAGSGPLTICAFKM